MSLTSYRAAPSRATDEGDIVKRDTVDFALAISALILEFFTRFGSDLLSHVLRRSTISATVLNDWVRNGARCFTRAMTTKPRKEFTISSVVQVSITVRGMCMTSLSSITRRALLLLDQIKPIEPLVPVN